MRKYTYEHRDIHNSYNSSSPQKRSSLPSPWWSCTEAVEHRKQAFRLFKKSPSPENFLNLKRQEASTKKILRNEKRRSWRFFCEDISSYTKLNTLWKLIKRYKNRYLTSTISYPTSSNGISQDMHNTIASLCPPSCVAPSPALMSPANNRPLTSVFDPPFSLAELHYVLNAMKKKKTSPGSDQITYSMISHIPKIYLPALLDILNGIFSTGNLPDSWNHSLIFLIPKSTPGKFRPISLTSCVLKTMERLVLMRLDWWLERYSKLPNSQYGFRRSFLSG